MTLVQRKATWAVVISVAIAASGAAPIAQGIPGIGTWKLNVAKSKYSPGPAPKSATVTFSAVDRA